MKQTSVPSAGFEPEIPAKERAQTYVLDSMATGTGCGLFNDNFIPLAPRGAPTPTGPEPPHS